ncbi:MAG TPA: prenyltransferase [Gaiellales bacterium]|jgi:1,4-dihydroxy-2-naphthoate polyprenyltransferase|nr:prenyltransferase [Gaiellales bacterium]
MGAVARGLWLELRVIPVLLWSFSAITLGTALGGGSDVEGWYYLGAVALGVLIQGVLAHTLNEIEDWRSGTDRHDSPRVISGGSKVLVAGLLTPRALKLLFAVAFVATTVLGLALVASRGLVMLPFGLAGVAGAVLYTLPPVRAAYRPFLGEAIACICLWLCVTGAAVLQGGRITATVAVAALAVAAYAVGMLMVHHYLDYEADRSATPTKTTTIVLLGLRRGRLYAIGWGSVALASAAGAAVAEPKLIPLAVAYVVGLVCHLRCRPDDVASVTTNEMGIIFFGIAGALISAALLVPALAWAALAAAALVALEMRLAVQPAETPAA